MNPSPYDVESLSKPDVELGLIEQLILRMDAPGFSSAPLDVAFLRLGYAIKRTLQSGLEGGSGWKQYLYSLKEYARARRFPSSRVAAGDFRGVILIDNETHLDQWLPVMEAYGRSERNKYRAVIYYMLVRHFNRTAVYD